MEPADPQELQNYFGYTFSNPALLTDALTRTAYLNDRQVKDLEKMDPLATLGDAILNAVIVQRLYEKGRQTKKTLSKGKSDQGRRDRTRAFAEEHKLYRFILWGKGEEKQDAQSQKKPLDTITEALIGAIYLDAEGQRKSGMKTVREILEKKNFFKDFP